MEGLIKGLVNVAMGQEDDNRDNHRDHSNSESRDERSRSSWAQVSFHHFYYHLCIQYVYIYMYHVCISDHSLFFSDFNEVLCWCFDMLIRWFLGNKKMMVKISGTKRYLFFN